MGSAEFAAEPDWCAAAIRGLSAFANKAAPDPECIAGLSAHGWERLQALKIDGLVTTGAVNAPLRRAYQHIAEIQYASVIELVEALTAREIRPLLFKGIDLWPRHFVGCAPSVMGDIDLLVERGAVGSARAALLGLGLRQAYFDQDSGELIDADIADIADVERSHYEMYPFRRLLPIDLDRESTAALRASKAKMPLVFDTEDRVWLIDEIDLHHGVALDVDAGPLFSRARAATVPGGLALDPADHLWLITSRFYNEVALHGKRSLRDFAYIAAILRDERLDWDRMLEVAAEYEMRPALFYYLRFVDSLFTRSRVKETIWRALDPRRGSRLRDWGWQLAPLLDSLDPMPLAVRRSAARVEPDEAG